MDSYDGRTVLDSFRGKNYVGEVGVPRHEMRLCRVSNTGESLTSPQERITTTRYENKIRLRARQEIHRDTPRD